MTSFLLYFFEKMHACALTCILKEIEFKSCRINQTNG